MDKPEQILPIVEKVLAENAEVLAAILSGDTKKKEFLIGRAMAESGGRAEPSVLRSLMEERFKPSHGGAEGKR
jgi:Asp-tRNA(Asn)/Glu-tRNA(Gln) amidotransferase B subunit